MANLTVPPILRLANFTPEKAAIKLLPEETACRYAIVPLWLERDTLAVAAASPLKKSTIRAISVAVLRPIKIYLASYPEVRSALARIYSGAGETTPQPRLDQVLLKLGHIDEKKLKQARAEQLKENETLEEVCHRLEYVEENDLAEALGLVQAIPHLRLESPANQPGLTPLIPWKTAQAQNIVPMWWIGNILFSGKSCFTQESPPTEPNSPENFAVRPVLCPPSQWNRIFKQLYLQGSSGQRETVPSLANILTKNGNLTELDLSAARAITESSKQSLEEFLLGHGLVTRPDWLKALSEKDHLPIEEIGGNKVIDPHIARLIPAPIAFTFSLLPLRIEEDKLLVGITRFDKDVILLAESVSGHKIEPRLVDPDLLKQQLEALYQNKAGKTSVLEPALEQIIRVQDVVKSDQLEQAKETALLAGNRWEKQLIQMDLLDEADLAELTSLQTGIPYALLDHACFEQELVERVPAELARSHSMIPLIAFGNDLWVATTDAMDGEGLQAIEAATGMRVWPVIAPYSAIYAAIERYYGAVYRSMDPRLDILLNGLVARNVLTLMGASDVLANFVSGKSTLDGAILSASPLAEQKVYQAMSEFCQVPLIDLHLQEKSTPAIDPLGESINRILIQDPVDKNTAHLIDMETAQHLEALPVRQVGDQLLVAFSSPYFDTALSEIQKLSGRTIKPCLATRSGLDEAIQRLLGRKNIGTYLLMAGLISRTQLNDALDMAQMTGVRLGQALVSRGYISQENLYQFLARQANLPFFDLSQAEFDNTVVRIIDPVTARKYGIFPIAEDKNQLTLGMVDPLNNEALKAVAKRTKKAVRPVLISDKDLEAALERTYSGEYLASSVSQLLERYPDDSAQQVLNQGQKVVLLLFLIVSLVWLIIGFQSYIIFINAILTLLYVVFSGYKFYLIYRAMSVNLEVPVSDEEVETLKDRDLPIYTILIPIFREANVLPVLLESLTRLNYPSTKLDIKILMEEDDPETINKFYELDPPPQFEGIIVPAAQPKTKPKALNYGLIHARGEYVVIYDAEDQPEPEQLKRALIAFRKSARDVVCIQAKLNYYNSRQNLLTRWFTIEYSMWFDLFLPGLDATGAPIPLGGTSNHFKKDALIESGAWDPYNVTEDADLGVRLYQRGYKTAIVDSTTFEEANSHLYNWIRQRSRWIKGYMQTWLVHMRHPLKLIDAIGIKAFLGFQFVVGGTFFTAILNPIYWIFTTIWFLIHWQFIPSIYPGIIFYLGAICLFFGNFAFTYMNVAGAMRRNYYDFIKYALLSPFYWGLMSVAAWRGLFQLIRNPHFWEKTIHGLYTPTQDGNKPVEPKPSI